MKKMHTIKALTAALGLLAFSSGASATIITEIGSVDDTVNGVSEIDFYAFDVLSMGTVTFTVDATGIGFMGSDLDSYLVLAFDDGDRSADDIVGTNDDGGPGYDSLLSLTLDVGSYLIGVSSCCISGIEFVAGENSSIAYGYVNPVYRLTIDFGVSTAAVPEPGTLALLGLGLAGMGMTRRKKKV